ncbi:MAG: hypothetical protein M5U17_17350 [Ignavibacterium sp.]|nr:hypothetical protein [Ignavibacterium sp.]
MSRQIYHLYMRGFLFIVLTDTDILGKVKSLVFCGFYDDKPSLLLLNNRRKRKQLKYDKTKSKNMLISSIEEAEITIECGRASALGVGRL